MLTELPAWQNFYVIVGSSAGALIGLMFVVIALLSSTRSQALPAAMRAFATPTIVYFSSVLLTAGTLSIPNHTRTSLGVSLLAIGTLGLAYIAWVGTHMRAQTHYAADRGDRLWFLLLPAAAYACALAAGGAVWSAPNVSLNLAGGGSMLLLLVGVHNAWDSAVWMVANAPTDRAE